MCNVKMISAQCGFCLRLYTLSIWDKMFSSHLCRHVQPICCGVSDILCVQPTLQYHSVQNPKMIHLKKHFCYSHLSHSTVADLVKICTTALFRRPRNFKGGVTSLKFGVLVWERPLMTSHIFWPFLTYPPTLSYFIMSHCGGYLGPPTPTYPTTGRQ